MLSSVSGASPSKERSSHVGRSVLRLEDDRLLRGAGRFVDDLDLAGQLWMRVVRSTSAHARLVSVETDAARLVPGVHAVLTGRDVGHVGPIPLRIPLPGVDMEPYLQPVLARDRVRYVGEPVAVVLAETPYLAEDAAELVEIELEELPAVVDAEAGSAGEPLRDDVGNEVACLEKGFGDVAGAFARAARVIALELRIGRHTGVPMETRGLVADYDSGRGHLTVWGATLVTHYHQRTLARLLDLPLTRIHYRSTDSGGSFGVRGDFFPEDFLVCYLATQLGRPIKWIEDRVEHLVATNHAREQLHRIAGAFAADGRLLAVRDDVWQAEGGYVRPSGMVIGDICLGLLTPPYRPEAYAGRLHAVTTNKTPIGPYRGPGRYQNTFARERLLDCAAAELGIDPVELRRRNLVTRDEIPYEPGIVMTGESLLLDSGDFPGLLDRAIEASGFDRWRREASELRATGRHVGNGIGYWMDKSGLGVYETAGIDVDPSGAIRLLTGGASTGQGIETALAQIAADELGVSPHDIEVIYGDTDLIPDGVGSWSSRSTVIGGSATRKAAKSAADKAKRVAAELLEVAPDDLELVGGRVLVSGSPGLGLSLGELAEACDAVSSLRRGETPGLGSREIYVDEHMNYPYGVNLVQVELDPDTGNVDVRRCFVAAEAGRAVNPLLIAGQVAGGTAQGLGGALLEELHYDENGQPRAASFVDYLIPTAVEVPEIETLILEDAPTPSNPLGAKGMGESGLIGMGAAVASAVDDALGRPGAIRSLPIMPERVRALIRGA
jgi:carbon-monoxide dehydrogenase large subunit/6-hydroxypseudooxynicotine dehydrogenase subunit gamma